MEYLEFNVIPPSGDTTVDIEAVLEDLFLSAFRAQLKHDKDFTYSENLTESKIDIVTDYPERSEIPLAKPYMLVANIAYSINFDASFFRDFYMDSFDPEQYNDKRLDTVLIPYSLVITAIGNSVSISKNLANRIINYMMITYKPMFDEIGLNIISANKSPTTGATRYPEKVFETSIQITGRLQWTGIVSVINKIKAHVLEDIDIDIVVNPDD